MNTRLLPVSAWLLVLGAGAVLVIGAFTHFDTIGAPAPAPIVVAVAPLTEDDPPAEPPPERPLPDNLSPGLAEIIKLAQAHVDESVILAYVKNSHQSFSPTADEILYLTDLGLSQNLVGILVSGPQPALDPKPAQQMAIEPVAAPAGAPEATIAQIEPPPAAPQTEGEANGGMFMDKLAPYGSWSQQPEYGLVWQPTIGTINSEWCPYVDGGQWVYSDSGWYWQSDYSWGWAAFHYGRWSKLPHQGWVWQPGDMWAPAWVAWRSSGAYIGWAALPPGVSLNVLAQLTYNSQPVGANSTLGLSSSAYTFVSVSNLTSHNLPRRVVPAGRAKLLAKAGTLIDSYNIVNNRIFNGGASPEAVGAARHKAVQPVALRSVASLEKAGLAMDRKTLGVFVPSAATAEKSSAKNLEVSTSRTHAMAERPPSGERSLLAENDLPTPEAVSTGYHNELAPVQLPPLRQANAPIPPQVRAGTRNIGLGSTDMAPPPGNWPREFENGEIQPRAKGSPGFVAVSAKNSDTHVWHFVAHDSPDADETQRFGPSATRYGSSPAEDSMGSGWRSEVNYPTGAARQNPNWQRAYEPAEVQRPITAAPRYVSAQADNSATHAQRFEAYNPPAREPEPPQYMAQHGQALAEARPVQIEPTRSAAVSAPAAASSSSSSSKSGK